MALDFEPDATEAGKPGRPRPSGDSPPPGQAYPPSTAADWSPILRRLGVAPQQADAVAARARATGVAFQTELLTSGLVEEAALFSALATELGLEFVTSVDPETLVVHEQDCLRALRLRGGIRIARAVEDGKETIHLLAPDRLNISSMRNYLRRYPKMAERLRITTPSTLRTAILKRARPALQRAACDGLFEYLPSCSARIVATARQGVFIGAFLVALPVCLSLALSLTTVVTHCVSSLFFLSCVALRIAVSGSGPGPLRQPRLEAFRPREMPVYTVLVALYKEAAIIPDLMVALGRIVWPRSKIEIKLVCEADDSETLAAIRAQKLRPWVEVIEVPPEGPRTKPKALSYALPTASGDFVVLYDAEDKPHPLQLVEAWQRFRDAGEDLACLQAPLLISNGRENRLAALFALEYSALFRGLLPWLAHRQVLLPLGGTSNHFRRKALDNVGAWDPFNMTEDADLGLRLKRFGYRTETLSYPTHEDAPDRLKIWLPQRTRWFKGWTQTWLVHMRNPLMLLRDLGPASFLVAQILFAGMLISALVHPLLLAALVGLGVKMVLSGPGEFSGSGLLIVDTLNVVGGYFAFLLLGWQTSTREERGRFWILVLLTPIYWSLMSIAAWNALRELYKRPHFWAKTPHEPRRRHQRQQTRRWRRSAGSSMSNAEPATNR